MSITTVLYHLFRFSFGVVFIVVVLYLWRISKLWFHGFNDRMQALAQKQYEAEKMTKEQDNE